MSAATTPLRSIPLLSAASRPLKSLGEPNYFTAFFRPPQLPPLSASLRHVALFRLPNCLPPTRRFSSASETPPESILDDDDEEEDVVRIEEPRSRHFRIGDWMTSLFLFGFYAAIMYYVTQLSPNQTPYRDMYFLKKLLNVNGDDGFRMNDVLVAQWYLMGLWPVLYSMLLLPTGRSSKVGIPVWPFISLSFFLGAYALIPYFILWTPPPPPVEEEEIDSWPLKFLESKITAGIVLAAVVSLFVYAGLADGSAWKEFYQYFRESRFIHVMSIDFMLLTAFSVFWIYNDMTARRFDKGIWLLLFAPVPLVGPALYLLMRPSLSALPTSMITNKKI